MEKINIAEILKDCPQGMELDCVMWNDVVFRGIDSSSPSYPIEIKIGDKNTVTEWLTEFGEWNANENSKCVIFPKGKTTWEGFQRPFKDGDIVITTLGNTAIIKEPAAIEYFAHCILVGAHLHTVPVIVCVERFATEEEKQKLFDAIKDNGYKWNEETKTLEKLIFKVGDRIILKDNPHNMPSIRIKAVTKSHYILENGGFIYMDSANEKYALEDKFDINTLVPFESKVLVRDSDKGSWRPSFWGYHEKCSCLMYNTVSGHYNQCIPYEGNEHLLGTTNDCNEYYKTWEERA